MLAALVLSHDLETVRVMRRVLDECRVQHESATALQPALEALGKRKFDAVIIDCDDLSGGKDVLKQVRETPSNKRAITFAIISNGTTVQDAFALGANFVLDKPLSPERAARSFRAAHGLMMRERRRYFRHKVKVAVSIYLPSGHEVKGMLTNLSETGVAIDLPQRIEKNTQVRVRFHLPATDKSVEAKGEIAWYDNGKQAGIRFLHIEQKVQRDLDQWLTKRFESAKVSGPLFINATLGKH
ncbi:MAG: response regulator [Acidobacteriales bacterium]|nr:response regulator [Terriglobales bacterium]